MLNKWILPLTYWMTTICHEPGILRYHLFQCYQTVIDIFTSYWKDVAKVTQVVRITEVHLVTPCNTPPSAWLSPVICFCGLVLLRIQHIFSHKKLTLYPHQTVTHTKGGHALVLRSLWSFTSSATGTFTHFVNVWISNNWPVIVWIIRIEWLMGATGSHIILWNPAYCTNLFLHLFIFSENYHCECICVMFSEVP